METTVLHFFDLPYTYSSIECVSVHGMVTQSCVHTLGVVLPGTAASLVIKLGKRVFKIRKSWKHLELSLIDNVEEKCYKSMKS